MTQKTQAIALNSGEHCPVCGGSGWIDVWEEQEGYGMVRMGRPCPECKSKRREGDKRNGIPTKYCDAALPHFSFSTYSRDVTRLEKVIKNVFEEFEEKWKPERKGVYLWSKTSGSGKTYLSCCLGRSISIKYDQQIRFITAPDYLAAVAESYKRQPGEEDSSLIYRTCDLLILDDIGTQKGSEWADQELFRLVNERLNEGKITYFTANTQPQELKLEGRTISRIFDAAIVLQMPEECVRYKKAWEKQNALLKGILG